MNLRQINHLNRLVRKGKTVLFTGGDGLFNLNEIKFLKRGEAGAEDETWAVYYFNDHRNWYFLQDCQFFTIKPIYGKI